MQKIKEDIKNNSFQKVYLLYGPENYLKVQYRNELIRALIPEGDTINFARYEGKNISQPEIIDLAETLPFFAEHRVIFIQNSGLMQGKADALADYMQKLPDHIVFIFQEEEVDKRSRLYKAVAKAGYAAEFNTQPENVLMRWILSLLKKEKVNIREDTLRLFLARTGPDMNTIRTELEKLFSYTAGTGVITTQDVETVCSERLEDRVFDMIRSVSSGRTEEAFACYHDLLALKVPPMRILYLLGREYNLLLQVKRMKDAGAGAQEIADRTGIRPFAVKKYLPVAGKYSDPFLENAVADFVKAETDVKTGHLGDQLSVELMIAKYSSAAQKR